MAKNRKKRRKKPKNGSKGLKPAKTRKLPENPPKSPENYPKSPKKVKFVPIHYIFKAQNIKYPEITQKGYFPAQNPVFSPKTAKNRLF